MCVYNRIKQSVPLLFCPKLKSHLVNVKKDIILRNGGIARKKIV